MKTWKTGRIGIRERTLVLLVFLAALVCVPCRAEAKQARLCRVTFADGSGNVYRSLSRQVRAGTTIRLPAVPREKHYKALGWATAKGRKKPSYKGGAAVAVKKDMTFYAVQEYCLTVTLHADETTVYRTLKVKKGDSLTLPGMKNQKGRTVLGWSASPGKTKNPKYQPGQKIKVTRSLDLYAVVFSRSEEPDLSASDINRWRKGIFGKKFKRVVFVGDSRIYNMKRALEAEFGTSVTKKVYFVCKGGTSIGWLRLTGIKRLMKYAKKGTAIIFNHGVNSLKSYKGFIRYMRPIGKELKAKGCTLFYMSVNPLNNASALSYKKPAKPEETLLTFNAAIKKELCQKGDFHYLDCYSYLIKNGYGTASTGSGGGDDGRDDGLHYTKKTYKRIFEFCMQSLSKF